MEIKRILENLYLENPKVFSLEINLPDTLIYIYNNIHATKKYKTNFLFTTSDYSVINKALNNIKISQKKFKNENKDFKKGDLCLMCENYIIKDKTIKYKKFIKKGKYSISIYY